MRFQYITIIIIYIYIYINVYLIQEMRDFVPLQLAYQVDGLVKHNTHYTYHHPYQTHHKPPIPVQSVNKVKEVSSHVSRCIYVHYIYTYILIHTGIQTGNNAALLILEYK